MSCYSIFKDKPGPEPGTQKAVVQLSLMFPLPNTTSMCFLKLSTLHLDEVYIALSKNMCIILYHHMWILDSISLKLAHFLVTQEMLSKV